jgi:plasmid stability protein
MPKMIQIRDVPDVLHVALKTRAAREGISLSDFLKRELEKLAERPSMQEWLDRTAQLKPIRSKRSSAQIIRALRDGR